VSPCVRCLAFSTATYARYPGEVIDKAEAERRFNSEISNARNYVSGLGINLTPGQEAALTSLTYNAGPGWINSGLGNAVKSGDWQTAAKLFTQYNKAGGSVNKVLANRRQAELSWLTGSEAPQTSAGSVASIDNQQAGASQQPGQLFANQPNSAQNFLAGIQRASQQASKQVNIPFAPPLLAALMKQFPA